MTGDAHRSQATKLRPRTGAALMMLLLCVNLLFLPWVTTPAKATETPIRHVVVIMQENHTFDNYFGTYPDANGLNGSSFPQQPQNSAAPVKPFHIAGSEAASDLGHAWQVAHDAYDSGKMDRFVIAEQSNLTMGYFNYQQIPYYWDYASQFVLFDNYYSSVMGPSLPNHLYLIAGQSGNMVTNSRFGTFNFTSSNIRDGAFYFTPVTDELDAAHVSWKYYAGGYQSLNNWNPLPAFASFKNNQSKLAKLAASERFAADVKSGNLPAVSWVMPSIDELSEHPPENVTAGQIRTVSLINTIMSSPYWNSTAIFLTWDDYGGWYDHVPPPQTFEKWNSALGFGFRVPCIVISPFAKHGQVDHTQADHASILKFIETIFSVPSLAPRDSNANNLFDAFTFDKPPRSPLLLPGPFMGNTYPLKPMLNASLVPAKPPPQGQSLPDLTIQKVSISPSRPRDGDMVSASFLVRNIGNAPATGLSVSLYLNDSTHSYQRIETTQTFDLKQGEVKMLSFASTIQATQGLHSLIVVIDDTGELKQIQTDNDAFIKAFRTLPAVETSQERMTVVYSTITTTTSQTVAVPTSVTETTTITTPSFHTLTSTVTQTQLTNPGQTNATLTIYGGILASAVAVMLVSLAINKRTAKVTEG